MQILKNPSYLIILLRRGAHSVGTRRHRPAVATGKQTNNSSHFNNYSFVEHLPSATLLQRIADGNLIRGRLRHVHSQEAYVQHPDSQTDVLIFGHLRNRALPDDIVAVKLLPVSNWKVNKNPSDRSPTSLRNYTSVKSALQERSQLYEELHPLTKSLTHQTIREPLPKWLRRVGKVVGILREMNSRVWSGRLLVSDHRNKTLVFYPDIGGYPMVVLLPGTYPPELYERYQDFVGTKFVCRVKEWPVGMRCPLGEIVSSIGDPLDIEPATQTLLLTNGIDFSEFSPEVLKGLPLQEEEFTIPANELETRRDFRSQCVFTIDPPTARDLDDALHVTSLGNDEYEVGVHIADVSYFVQPDTELDKVAADRTTSVYLVQKAIPMLPAILSEKLCSLNQGKDRLTFSVVFRINEQGEILSEWFGKSVIRSCMQLSYDHGHDLLEGRSKEGNTLPAVEPPFTLEKVSSSLSLLYKIAQNLRAERFRSGALKLDKVELSFSLNPEEGADENALPGWPRGYTVKTAGPANELIEEWMLLANEAVARRLQTAHGTGVGLLRRHPPPTAESMRILKSLLEAAGVPLDISSSGALQSSVKAFAGNAAPGSVEECKAQSLIHLCYRRMQLALYFSVSLAYRTLKGDQKALTRYMHHYGLNVPAYTHFTSPIRRYADILVHRQLSALVSDQPGEVLDALVLSDRAEQCNRKRLNSKRVQESSQNIFIAAFIKASGPTKSDGYLLSRKSNRMELLFPTFGLSIKLNKHDLADVTIAMPDDSKVDVPGTKRVRPVTVTWPPMPDQGCPHQPTMTLNILDPLPCILDCSPDRLEVVVQLVRPDCQLCKESAAHEQVKDATDKTEPIEVAT